MLQEKDGCSPESILENQTAGKWQPCAERIKCGGGEKAIKKGGKGEGGGGGLKWKLLISTVK